MKPDMPPITDEDRRVFAELAELAKQAPLSDEDRRVFAELKKLLLEEL